MNQHIHIPRTALQKELDRIQQSHATAKKLLAVLEHAYLGKDPGALGTWRQSPADYTVRQT